jgi:AbrB family looped-hinge helix DNA binding protein
MHTTIDSGGRIVIPKRLRDRFGLRPGQEVEIAEGDGVITVAPRYPPTHVEERDGVYVAVTDLAPAADVDSEATRDVLEAVRERRA